MKTTTLQLLPTTTFGTPSGNYDGSSSDWAGLPQQAANYYGGFGDLQTLAFFLLSFQGRIIIEATMASTPESDLDWFQVDEVDSTSEYTTSNFSRNLSGNFVWLRARVKDFTSGTITKLTLAY